LIRRLLALTAVVVLAAAAAAGAAGYWAWQQLTVPVELGAPVEIEVAVGEGSRSVAARLEAAGVVRSGHLLLALARWRGVDKKLHYGSHRFQGAVTAEDVLAELATPPVVTTRITIPEGLTWQEIGELLEARELVTAAAWSRAVCRREFLDRAGAVAGANCAEGYLFPDTYDLAPQMSAEQIADLMLARFREVALPLIERFRPYVDREFDSTTRRNRVLTIASIVEKETGVAEERPLVAAVVRNRLRRGMPLQMDPTVIYGVRVSGKGWDVNITRKHLTEPTPYNTYTIPELPPGPICNPGRAAIAAAVEPADADYLYFVAKAAGGAHHFSSSLREHTNAVRRYQLR
jgi:UPF0755 protein